MRRGFKMYQAAGKFAAMLMLAGVLAVPAAFGQAASNRGNVLFTQQDRVVAFNPGTGVGQQVGTATGKINGTTIVDFQFTPLAGGQFSFINSALLTDLDGDQVKFLNVGTGQFIIPLDTTFTIGGPLVGTYEAVSGSGKYASWVGKKFPYRAVASNSQIALGTVYVEVYSNPIK